MVFRANVPVQDIYYISLGGPVTINVDGLKDQVTGTVVKIFPSKITLSNGEAVYQVVGKWLKGVFPVSTGIVVSALARPEWLVEIDVIAVIPEAD